MSVDGSRKATICRMLIWVLIFGKDVVVLKATMGRQKYGVEPIRY